MKKKDAISVVAYHVLTDIIAGNLWGDPEWSEEIEAVRVILGVTKES